MCLATIIASLCLSLAGPVRAQVLPLHHDRHTLQAENDRTLDLSAAKWKGPVLNDPRFQDAAAAEAAFSSSSSTITISTTAIIIALLIIILILVA